MLSILIKVLVPVITALIGAFGAYLAYGRNSKATMTVAKMNQKNVHIKQYNDLFERNHKLSDEIYQIQHDSLMKSQDSIVIFYELEDAINQLKVNGIKPHSQLVQVAKNYHKRLHDDSNNSL